MMTEWIYIILLAVSLVMNVLILIKLRNVVKSERNGTQILLKDRKGTIKTGIIRDES
jgi:hypothetical protein